MRAALSTSQARNDDGYKQPDQGSRQDLGLHLTELRGEWVCGSQEKLIAQRRVAEEQRGDTVKGCAMVDVGSRRSRDPPGWIGVRVLLGLDEPRRVSGAEEVAQGLRAAARLLGQKP